MSSYGAGKSRFVRDTRILAEVGVKEHRHIANKDSTPFGDLEPLWTTVDQPICDKPIELREWPRKVLRKLDGEGFLNCRIVDAQIAHDLVDHLAAQQIVL